MAKETHKSKKKKKYRKGSVIVGLQGVFQIKKIKRRRNYEGDVKSYYVLKPLFKNTGERSSLTSLVPVDSIDKTGKREPVSRNKMRVTIRELGKKKRGRKSMTVKDLDQATLENDPEYLGQALQLLYLDQIKSDTFAAGKRKLFDMIKKVMIEETAYLEGISVEEAEAKIDRALNKVE